MLSRVVTARTASCRATTRFLSSEAEIALGKLKQVIEDYRAAKRFRKEIVSVATNPKNEVIMSGMRKLLQNIGAENKISDDELRIIFAEVGQGGVISADRVATLF